MAPNTNEDNNKAIYLETVKNNEDNTSEVRDDLVHKKSPTDHEDDDHPVLTLSLTQMCKDLYNLDFSGVLWDMTFWMVLFHILAGYGFYIVFFVHGLTLKSFIFTALYAYLGGVSVTMGAHRLWTHRAFDASLTLRIVLMLLNCTVYQESLLIWCQNHRAHHRFTDTDKDFTNSRRGFFFAHMGWKMYQTHPEAVKARTEVNIEDLLKDKVVMFQHNYYYYLSLPLCFVLPALFTWYFFEENWEVAFFFCSCARLAITFHSTWCINSVAHLYGYKPYDTSVHSFDNTIFGPWSLGEGWHNYHHTFPEDYRASELNGWGENLTTNLIELLSKLGHITNLKTASLDRVERRTLRTGDPELRQKALNRET